MQGELLKVHRTRQAFRNEIASRAKPEYERPISLKPWRDWNEERARRAVNTYNARCMGNLVQVNNLLLISGSATPVDLKVEREKLAFRTVGFLKRVVRAVASGEGVTAPDIFSGRRQQKIVHARFIFIHIALTMTSYSLVRIGRFLGNKDHTTILHGRDRIVFLMNECPELRERVERYCAELQAYSPSFNVSNSQPQLTGQWHLSTA